VENKPGKVESQYKKNWGREAATLNLGKKAENLFLKSLFFSRMV
jgi:hypothetical protein